MDERIWTIAEILDQSGPMTADELAAQLKLSGKTVRSLIKTYAKEMQENGFCITAKPGRGFGIEITDAQTYVSGSKPQQGEQTGIPQDAQERAQRIRELEALAHKTGQTQLFIETPYRNAALWQALLQVLQPHTRLALASGLTLPEARVHSLPVRQWRQHDLPPDNRTPVVFALGH